MYMSVYPVTAVSNVPMRELLPVSGFLCHVTRLGAAGLSGALYWTLGRDARHYVFR